MNPRNNILIVHGYSGQPLRSTIRDSLYSFKNYANGNVFYLNLYHEFDVPKYIKSIDFDLIIFHTTFMSFRWWGGEDFFQNKIIKKCEFFISSAAQKAIMPQDEWIHTSYLVKFVNILKINQVFSVAPQSEWKKIYSGVEFNKVQFYQILTGYIDDNLLNKINKIKEQGVTKSVDIGYRAFKSPPWLGSHGFLKTKIADVFLKKTAKSKLTVNISTDPKDVFMGDGWYQFLLKCKYFIGVEGGSTIIDPDGSIWKKGDEFTKNNPDASFTEVEKACFPNMDGNLNLIVLSPRHLEACFTNTCQVLIEGDYNGILNPHEHYIPLKKDFSNIDDVLVSISNDNLRENIVKNTLKLS